MALSCSALDDHGMVEQLWISAFHGVLDSAIDVLSITCLVEQSAYERANDALKSLLTDTAEACCGGRVDEADSVRRRAVDDRHNGLLFACTKFFCGFVYTITIRSFNAHKNLV